MYVQATLNIKWSGPWVVVMSCPRVKQKNRQVRGLAFPAAVLWMPGEEAAIELDGPRTLPDSGIS